MRDGWNGENLQETNVWRENEIQKKNDRKPAARAAVRVFVIILCGVFAGAAAGAVFYRQMRLKRQAPVVENSSEDEPEISPSAFTYSVSDISREIMPAVVAITTTSVQELESFFGYSRSYESVETGSGIIIGANEKELYIATNNHVISDSKTLSVAFIDETAASATVKGADRDNDVAVIAVQLSSLEESTKKAVRTAVIGDSTEVEVGQKVVAIGNALGYGQSVTSGYVSAINRRMDSEEVGITLIQTDAAINPGNSGGPLLNMKGELIGINMSKYASYDVEGMGYAIPISTASPILDDLIQIESRSKVSANRAAYLGVMCRDVTEEASMTYGMPRGAYVDEVKKATPAEAVGIMAGDIIVGFENRKIQSSDDLLDALSYYAAGESVDVTVQRTEDGEYREITFHILLARKKS